MINRVVLFRWMKNLPVGH